MYARLGGETEAQLKGLYNLSGTANIGELSKWLESNVKKGAAGLGKAVWAKAADILQSISTMQGNLPFTRVDAPLNYKSSNRRQFEFMLNLVAIKNRFKEVVEPVRFLQYLSSPQATSIEKTSEEGKMTSMGNTAIKPPWLFRITTVPEGTLFIKLAALTTVQPTFKGPWIAGVPTYCELRLSFMEYMPLFDKTFDTKNTGFAGKITARESQIKEDYDTYISFN
jgi:hypothetical protein